MPERWPLFDDVPTGHHPGYVDRIVAAVLDAGIEPTVATPSAPPSLSRPRDWVPVEAIPHRAVRASRKQWRSVIARARAAGIDTLVDLYLDKNIWAADIAATFERRIHILHHATQYSTDDRTGLAGIRTRYLRRRLRAITRAGARVVVHTPRARQILGDALDDSGVVLAGYPVPTIQVAPPGPAQAVPNLLFIGAGRKEKGLDVLLSALPLMAREVRLRVVGSQPPGLRTALDPGDNRVVTWIDRRVSDQELWEEYSKADIAVLPYRRSFGQHGGPSSVLLETLGSGLPIVTTPALATQLADHRKGSVVADDDSPQALARAIDDAIAVLGELTVEAADHGPEFIRREHSYDAYVAALRRASEDVHDPETDE